MRRGDNSKLRKAERGGERLKIVTAFTTRDVLRRRAGKALKM